MESRDEIWLGAVTGKFYLFFFFVFGHTTISVECHVEYIQFNYLRNISKLSIRMLHYFFLLLWKPLKCCHAMSRSNVANLFHIRTIKRPFCDAVTSIWRQNNVLVLTGDWVLGLYLADLHTINLPNIFKRGSRGAAHAAKSLRWSVR